MKAPAIYPDEPEPANSTWFAGSANTTASAAAVPTGAEIAANIHRAIDQLTRRTLVVNPADEDRLRAAAMERALILGPVQVTTAVPPGAVYVLTLTDHTDPEFPQDHR